MSNAKQLMKQAHSNQKGVSPSTILPNTAPNYSTVTYQPGAPAPIESNKINEEIPREDPFAQVPPEGPFYTSTSTNEFWSQNYPVAPPTEPPTIATTAHPQSTTPIEKKAPVQPIRQATKPIQEDAPKRKSTKTAIEQIARPELPTNTYGIRPVATNFNCYNKEVFDWLRTFSSENQFNGGVAITKSQLIEIILDVMVYDLNIQAQGYPSQQALREAIQVAMVAYQGQSE